MAAVLADKEFETLAELDRAAEKKYKGKWIARDGTRLLVAGDNLEEVVAEAKKLHVESPVVRQIPTKKPHFCFF